MLKRPNTIKMHRLLQALAECDPRNAAAVRELQADTRKVLGLAPASAAATKKKPPGTAATIKSRKPVRGAKKAIRRPTPAARK